MATTRKPAAKKTTAVRKTTPRRKATPKTPTPVPQDPTVNVVYTEEQKQAKLEAYHTLKAAGLTVPQDLAIEVEIWVAELQAQRQAEAEHLELLKAQREQDVAQANKNGPWYVRNGYPAAFNLRLDRQTEKRRIELKPRGTPGDLHPIKDEDLGDPILRQNLGLGLIEIIPAGEAQIIIEKQTHNMSHRVHTPLAILRNEKGQVYQEGAVKVETEYNAQGITVAHVDQRVLTGELHDREVGGTRGHGGLTRVNPGTPVQQQAPVQATQVVHSQFVPTGGNPASVQYGAHNNAQAKVVDDLARRKDIQGPAAGLGGISVVVEPVRKT